LGSALGTKRGGRQFMHEGVILHIHAMDMWQIKKLDR
jgi:hypothetical protein